VTNAEFAGVLLAKERGWYAEAGLDVTIKGWKSGISVVDDVSSGKAQIGVAEGDQLIRARARGESLKAIATQFQKSPRCYISKKERGIDTVEELIGKRVGGNDLKNPIVLKSMLDSKGLRLEDLTLVDVGWNLQTLIDDEVDVFPAFLTNEPLIMKEKGYDVNVIPAYQHGYDFYSGVYFVHETMIQEQPDVIERFLETTFRGWREAFQDPDAAAQCIVEHYYPEGSIQQQTEELKLFQSLATLGVGEELLGMMGELIWRKGIDILHRYGEIEQKIPAGDAFTIEFLKNVYRRK
jgi:ABC-type nitrate/sulfonate/bicarbonate transport system substrate-binding protein